MNELFASKKLSEAISAWFCEIAESAGGLSSQEAKNRRFFEAISE